MQDHAAFFQGALQDRNIQRRKIVGQCRRRARRLTGKYLAPETGHLLDRVAEIARGDCEAALKDIMSKTTDELKDMYNHRDFEK